jgi:hypothetical protein
MLVNWCQKWWEYYPNPPIEVLDIIEQLLAYHDPELVSHFKANNITGHVFRNMYLTKDILLDYDSDVILRNFCKGRLA